MLELNVDHRRIEKLIADGHPPDRARKIALKEAAMGLARGVAAAQTPDEIVELADRVRAGGATVVQLADRIATKRSIDRDTAFTEAMSLLSDRGARLAAVPLDPSAAGGGAVALSQPKRTPKSVTIVQLADRIAKEKGVDRETAFGFAEREIRAR